VPSARGQVQKSIRQRPEHNVNKDESLRLNLTPKLRTVGIDLVDHVLQFCFCGVLSEGPHHRSQFLGGDRSIAVLVEKRERFFELGDLFLSQLVRLKSQIYDDLGCLRR
jgi:hypothetical protein